MILIMLDWFTFFRSFSPDHSFTKNIHSDSKPHSSKPEYYLFTLSIFPISWRKKGFQYWTFLGGYSNLFLKHRRNTWKFFNQNLFDVLVFCKFGFGKERLKYHIHATKKFEFSKYFCQSFIDRKFIKVVSLLHRHAKFVIDSKHIAANMAHKWWAT